jgi:hypothetical protein
MFDENFLKNQELSAPGVKGCALGRLPTLGRVGVPLISFQIYYKKYDIE